MSCAFCGERLDLDILRDIIGGKNWVIARRTKSIVERYGEDVICLTQKQYKEAERLARLRPTEGYD